MVNMCGAVHPNSLHVVSSLQGGKREIHVDDHPRVPPQCIPCGETSDESVSFILSSSTFTIYIWCMMSSPDDITYMLRHQVMTSLSSQTDIRFHILILAASEQK